MARLSATLIVRDESAFIEGCLDTLVGTVDEIVIVDTGSKDDTIEKARRYPIALHHFPWCDDFSAARNSALDRAHGDWILYIDADERLEVRDRRTLRNVLEDETKAAWKLRLHPRIGWTAYSELRLFRRDPRLRFSGTIHERVHPSVDAVCRSDGLTIGSCDLALHHVGYEGDQSHKLARNIPLLRTYLQQDPSRVYCWWHLGEMLRLSGHEQDARNAWQTGTEVVRAQPLGLTSHSDSLPFLSLIQSAHANGIAIDQLLDEALELFPRHLALQWVAAKLAIERGDDEGARTTLEALAAINPETFFDPEIAYEKALFSHLARETLALCHFRAGRYAESARFYRMAATGSPDPAACELKARLAEARAAQREHGS